MRILVLFVRSLNIHIYTSYLILFVSFGGRGALFSSESLKLEDSVSRPGVFALMNYKKIDDTGMYDAIGNPMG